MTSWATPRTWGASDTPTAAQLNADVRDNMLHLRENRHGFSPSDGGEGFGFVYTVDPRLRIAYDTVGINDIGYWRVYGAGPVNKVIIAIGTSAGNISLGAYRNADPSSGNGAQVVITAASQIVSDTGTYPEALLAATAPFTCPAIGVAITQLVLGGQVTMEPGDWLAFGSDSTATIGRGRPFSGSGGTGLGSGLTLGVAWASSSGGIAMRDPATVDSFPDVDTLIMTAYGDL